MTLNSNLFNHKYEGILFDLDGTLLDTASDLGNALNHVLNQHKRKACEYDAYRCVASDGALGLLKLGFGEDFANLSKTEVETCRQMLLDHYQQNVCVDTTLFEGVEELLEDLNQQQIPWGIVTNKPSFLTEALLTNFPIMSYSGCVISGDTYIKRKPHPLPLLEAAKALKVKPENTLYVGDALRDIEAANNANMVSVAALYGYINDPKEVQEWKADYSVERFSQIYEIN
ncbi:HAD family hydrolase [Aliiglaciecola lipolytica]|uniref:Phosphoglycolate phosphatase n=1 Tax=Aliiglaciecola lipolytica E3 TaxID=1127673 RepID=K6Y8B8_9ALTE|nr:HAD-IA family hydrolase [Aliiglaciecola lipolytica]GAC12878.1 phosphoglycolate phosphatase [Aliiglaciecola lipolytica E3]